MQPYSAILSNDVLTIENSRIARRYRWKGGDLISQSVTDKRAGHEWQLQAGCPDMLLSGAESGVTAGSLTVVDVPETPIAPAHGRAEISFRLGELEVRSVFRLYTDCPAIAYDFYLRGSWAETSSGPRIMERIVTPRPHLGLTCVQFSDITDRCNNLVDVHKLLPYR